MGTQESFADWHKEFAARERALQDRLRAEADAAAEEERRLAALDPFSVGAQVEVIQGFYKGKVGTVSQRVDDKVRRGLPLRKTAALQRGRVPAGATRRPNSREGPGRQSRLWLPLGHQLSSPAGHGHIS